jgi:hypothetical protein
LADNHESDSLFKWTIPLVHGKRNMMYCDHIYDCHEKLGLTKPSDTVKMFLENMHVVMIVSGAGKTRTCVDISRKRWTIYVDCSKDEDFLCMIETMSSIKPAFLNSHDEQNDFEIECFNLFLKFLLLRLLMLQKLCADGKVQTPYEWFCYQRGHRTRKELRRVFQQVEEVDAKYLQGDVARLANELNVKVIFDSSQHLLEIATLQHAFNSFSYEMVVINGVLRYPASLYGFLATKMILDLGIHSAWCGTHLDLTSINLYKSTSGQLQNDYFRVFHQFNYLKEGDIFDILNLYLSVGEHLPEATIREMCHLLQGRPQFLSSFLQELIANSDERNIPKRIQLSFDNFVQGTILPGKKDSLYTCWKECEPITTPARQLGPADTLPTPFQGTTKGTSTRKDNL